MLGFLHDAMSIRAQWERPLVRCECAFSSDVAPLWHQSKWWRYN